jgi:hypothetical protein
MGHPEVLGLFYVWATRDYWGTRTRGMGKGLCMGHPLYGVGLLNEPSTSNYRDRENDNKADPIV